MLAILYYTQVGEARTKAPSSVSEMLIRSPQAMPLKPHILQTCQRNDATTACVGRATPPPHNHEIAGTVGQEERHERYIA